MGSVGCAPRAAPWVLPGVCLFCFNVPLRPDEARHCGDSSYRPAGHSSIQGAQRPAGISTRPPPSSWEWIPPRKTKAILQRYDPSHSYADLLSTSTYVCDDSQLVAQAVGINSCVALLPCATQHLGHSVCWSHPRSLSFGSFLCSELSLQHPNGFVFAHQDSKALEEDSLAQLHSQLRNGKTRMAALVPSTKRFMPWALTVKNKTFARNRSAHLWGFISQHIPKALPQKTCL